MLKDRIDSSRIRQWQYVQIRCQCRKNVIITKPTCHPLLLSAFLILVGDNVRPDKDCLLTFVKTKRSIRWRKCPKPLISQIILNFKSIRHCSITMLHGYRDQSARIIIRPIFFKRYDLSDNETISVRNTFRQFVRPDDLWFTLRRDWNELWSRAINASGENDKNDTELYHGLYLATLQAHNH